MVNPISPHSPNVNKLTADQVHAEPSTKLEATPGKADVVQLSVASQAKLLKQQGFDVQEIAIKLGLDIKTVSTYLPSVSEKA
jgi:hypothetical protein